jgi:hypothetical protein
MKAADFQLGQRVRRRSGDSSFVRDRTDNPALKGRRVGVVIGLPQPISDRQRGVMIRFEGSTVTETVPIHRLELLPDEQQPVELGGQWTPVHTLATAQL